MDDQRAALQPWPAYFCLLVKAKPHQLGISLSITKVLSTSSCLAFSWAGGAALVLTASSPLADSERASCPIEGIASPWDRTYHCLLPCSRVQISTQGFKQKPWNFLQSGFISCYLMSCLHQKYPSCSQGYQRWAPSVSS